MVGLAPPESTPICTSPFAVMMKTGLPLSPATVPPSRVEVGTVSLKTLFKLPFGFVEFGFAGSRNCASKNGALPYPMMLPSA
jgi:hypothetical protein